MKYRTVFTNYTVNGFRIKLSSVYLSRLVIVDDIYE